MGLWAAVGFFCGIGVCAKGIGHRPLNILNPESLKRTSVSVHPRVTGEKSCLGILFGGGNPGQLHFSGYALVGFGWPWLTMIPAAFLDGNHFRYQIQRLIFGGAS